MDACPNPAAITGTFCCWHHGARCRTVGWGATTNCRGILQRLRQLIVSKQESILLSGEIEADESYFGGTRRRDAGEGLLARSPCSGY